MNYLKGAFALSLLFLFISCDSQSITEARLMNENADIVEYRSGDTILNNFPLTFSGGGVIDIYIVESTGEVISQVIHDDFAAGCHTIEIDISFLDVGVYSFLMISGSLSDNFWFEIVQ
ncbi:hypothetical protein KKB18_07160 [bacterium]|nr:hypothetical protein [bacterium]